MGHWHGRCRVDNLLQMDEPVMVRLVQGEMAAEQLQAFLAANGIPTAVRGESLRVTHAFTLDGLGAVRIYVEAERAEEALALLDRVDRGELELDGSEEPLTDGPP